MAQDWSADVKKYAPDADDGIIAGIVRHCGIALHKVDSALVAFSDKTETDRVRDGFCRKKLALTQDDAELDRVIASVGERMKGDRTKNRVTVYYLLAEAFDKLQLFAKAPAAAKAGSGADATATAKAAGAAAAAGASPLLAQKGAARGSEMAQEMPEAEPIEAAAETVHDVADTPTAVAAGLGAAGMGAIANEAVAHEPMVEPAPSIAPPATPVVEQVAEPAPLVAPVMAAPVEAAPPARPAQQSRATTPIKAVLPSSALPDPRPAGEPGRSRREQYISTPDEEEVVEGGDGGSMKWLPWLLLGLGVLALLWFFLIHRPHEAAEDAAPVATTPVTTVAPPAESGSTTTTTTAAVTIPTGAGVTSETIDGKPAVNVYFDTAKTAIAPAFAAAATAVKTYLDANPAATLALSGYNDKTGNAAANAELSKNRAQAVQAALVATGIPATAVALVKPADTTDTGVVDDSAARRVEVRVK